MHVPLALGQTTARDRTGHEPEHIIGLPMQLAAEKGKARQNVDDPASAIVALFGVDPHLAVIAHQPRHPPRPGPRPVPGIVQINRHARRRIGAEIALHVIGQRLPLKVDQPHRLRLHDLALGIAANRPKPLTARQIRLGRIKRQADRLVGPVLGNQSFVMIKIVSDRQIQLALRQQLHRLGQQTRPFKYVVYAHQVSPGMAHRLK